MENEIMTMETRWKRDETRIKTMIKTKIQRKIDENPGRNRENRGF
jgi:hypothetical protein